MSEHEKALQNAKELKEYLKSKMNFVTTDELDNDFHYGNERILLYIALIKWLEGN